MKRPFEKESPNDTVMHAFDNVFKNKNAKKIKKNAKT